MPRLVFTSDCMVAAKEARSDVSASTVEIGSYSRVYTKMILPSSSCKQKLLSKSELQIRRSYDENSKIIFHISQ